MGTGKVPLDFFKNPYGYTPTLAICIVYSLLFLFSFFAHIVQAFKHRMIWLFFTTALCAIMETLGWGSRLWSNLNMENHLPFKLQYIMTVVAPTPLLATNFIVLGRIIPLLGIQYNLRIFLTCDIVALISQTLGVVFAVTKHDPSLGSNIMIAGIAFQAGCIAIFGLIAIEFFWRWKTAHPVQRVSQLEKGVMNRRVKWLSYALALSTGFILIRAIYRLVELIDGFFGTIARTEWYFDVFEALPIIIALVTWNVAHPGTNFPKDLGSNPSLPNLNPDHLQLIEVDRNDFEQSEGRVPAPETKT
ncbi:RTA1 like protein-domain-containing protein [Flagelloscypha sp. PMI_526]|nr:RTA1 like protein-domain-containing protein [Flagelloscypha sp. PMI_526]